MSNKQPDHPDFALLLEAVNFFDNMSELGKDVRALMAEDVQFDIESVVYMTSQRCVRVLMSHPQLAMNLSEKRKGQVFDVLGSAWLDGFAAGVRAERKRTEAQQEGTS